MQGVLPCAHCILYITKHSTLTELAQKKRCLHSWRRMVIISAEFSDKQSHEIGTSVWLQCLRDTLPAQAFSYMERLGLFSGKFLQNQGELAAPRMAKRRCREYDEDIWKWDKPLNGVNTITQSRLLFLSSRNVSFGSGWMDKPLNGYNTITQCSWLC